MSSLKDAPLLAAAGDATEDDERPPLVLPNCFALERKHKTSKKHMVDRKSGKSQERCVCEETDQVAVGIRMPSGFRFGVGDVVWASRGIVGKVTDLVIDAHGHPLARVEVWTELKYDPALSLGIYCLAKPIVHFIQSADVRGSAIHRPHKPQPRCTAIWA